MEARQGATEHHLRLRNIAPEDYPGIRDLMDEIYPDIGGAWRQDTIESLIAEFPEGQLCIEDNGVIVAAALTVKVDYNRFSSPHSYRDLMARGNRIRHDPEGDALYGLDVFVSPGYRELRLGRRLYDARKELCVEENLRGILAGGRIVNYHKYAEELTPEAYIAAVRRKEVYDPILTFQLANDFEVKRLMRGYLPEDDRSLGYATLLEWNNIYYEPEDTPLVEVPKTEVRVGVVQWHMRPIDSVEALLVQVEYFVDALSDYESDFILFPEFFTAPLMGLGDQDRPDQAVRYLAGFTEEILAAMKRFAVTYNVNIVAGSMPVLENERLYNVSFLCRRSGVVDTQYKIHITPHERDDWVMHGGDRLTLFETDAGRVGILICYDVEFPELSRLLAQEGVDILFVPLWTDTKNGFLRVQRCAQARAIENECYVAIAGSTGNLPQVDNVDLQYAQSGVYAPSDFQFPHDAVMAEATANAEQLLVVDLDFEKLKELRETGSVTNRKDRREDLYALRWTGAGPVGQREGEARRVEAGAKAGVKG